MKSVPIGGGTVTVLAQGYSGPAGIAVDDTTVYWANTNGGNVVSVPKAGGTPKILVSYTTTDHPIGIAVNASSVFFTSDDSPGAVDSAPLTGGTPTVLSSVEVYPWAITVDAKNVYWTDNVDGTGTISSMPLGGGAVTVLSGNHNAPTALAVDGSNVYFTAADGGRVWKLTLP